MSNTYTQLIIQLVFAVKGRKSFISETWEEELYKYITAVVQNDRHKMLAINGMPDHIHILVKIPPKMSISNFMGYLKGKSAMMIFARHGNLKYKFGNNNFWSTGYYVSTVGLNEATIAKYIREQEKTDQMIDKISVKELEDPFKD